MEIKTIRGRRQRYRGTTAAVLAVEKSWHKTISRPQFIIAVPAAAALFVAYTPLLLLLLIIIVVKRYDQ